MRASLFYCTGIRGRLKAMKKIITLTALCVVVASIATWYWRGTGDKVTHEIKLDGHSLTVEFARTPDEHTRGLMYRHELAENAGMLFLFTEAGQKTFWNKNTLIPLDVIWLYNDQVVGVGQLPAIDAGLTTIISPPNTNRVLEVNRGWAERHGVQIGARMW